MTAHDDLRRDATALLAFLDRLTTEVPALISRAQIPTGRDGFPRTASGADRSSPGSAPEMPQAGTRQAETGLWGFECSCGHESRLIYPTQLSARAVAESHLDSHAGSTLDYGDPTGDAAVARPEPDPAKARLRAVRRNLDDIHRRAQTILNILDAEKERPEPSRDDDPGCQSCARTHSPLTGQPRWEITRTTTDVGGILRERMRLCRWCADATARLSRLPTVKEVNDHHIGKKLRQKAS